MKTKVTLVERRALLCVAVPRKIAVEWVSDVRKPGLLNRLVRDDVADRRTGADRLQAVAGMACWEPLTLGVIGRSAKKTAGFALLSESGVQR